MPNKSIKPIGQFYSKPNCFKMMKLEDMTDEELALSYIKGNNKAFDLLLLRNQSKLYAYIFFVVHDRDKAEDIFQETFLKAISKLNEGKYITSGKFSAWLMRIAHNIIMDQYRDVRLLNIVELADDNDLTDVTKEMLDKNVENRYVNEQVFHDARSIMNMLPPPQREVVFMRFFQDLPFKEIAELTGVSINTSLGRMRYAVLNMRRIARQFKVELMLE